MNYTDKYLGATVRATNRTHGLRPWVGYGELETVAEILDTHSLLIKTVEGNVYSNGDFTVIRFAEQVSA